MRAEQRVQSSNVLNPSVYRGFGVLRGDDRTRTGGSVHSSLTGLFPAFEEFLGLFVSVSWEGAGDVALLEEQS